MRSIHSRVLSRTALILAAALTSAAAQAGAVTSDGFGASITLNAPVGAVSLAPVAPDAGTAPPDYAHSNSAASINSNLGLTVPGITTNALGLTSGLVTTSVAGNAAANTASATVTIADPKLGLDSGLLGVLTNLLGLDAKAITSTSSIGAGLAASGSSSIVGANLGGTSLLGISLAPSLFVNPAPNTQIIGLPLLGLTVLLNEQIVTGDGVTSRGITTNALHLIFNNFLLGTDTLSGDVILGHSHAAATLSSGGTPVPEPGMVLLFALGLLLIGVPLGRVRRGAAFKQI